MKKLMIAAALAAMIGGAFADGYDFTASVKTTKGKYGSQKTTYTVNLGTDEDGVYWWDDLGFDNEKEAKAYVKSLSNEDKADLADDLNFDRITGENDYDTPELYKGKLRWCYTFKFTEVDEDCYRVPGSAKLRGIVVIDACCGDWEFGPYNFGKTEFADEDGMFYHQLLYRINGVSSEKANKVEAAGTIGDVSFDGTVIGTFAYAGQGVYDVKNARIASISGNIVGVLENPDCESCCDYNTEAVVFECADGDDEITSYNDTPDGTAAYGSFTLKYNKKYDL